MRTFYELWSNCLNAIQLTVGVVLQRHVLERNQVVANLESSDAPDVALQFFDVRVGAEQVRRVVPTDVELEVLGGPGWRSVRGQDLWWSEKHTSRRRLERISLAHCSELLQKNCV